MEALVPRCDGLNWMVVPKCATRSITRARCGLPPFNCFPTSFLGVATNIAGQNPQLVFNFTSTWRICVFISCRIPKLSCLQACRTYVILPVVETDILDQPQRLLLYIYFTFLFAWVLQPQVRWLRSWFSMVTGYDLHRLKVSFSKQKSTETVSFNVRMHLFAGVVFGVLMRRMSMTTDYCFCLVALKFSFNKIIKHWFLCSRILNAEI